MVGGGDGLIYNVIGSIQILLWLLKLILYI